MIDVGGFDAILKMDWLSTSHATIDCHKGCVIFRVPNHPEFIFQRGAESIEPTRSWMMLNCEG